MNNGGKTRSTSLKPFLTRFYLCLNASYDHALKKELLFHESRHSFLGKTEKMSNTYSFVHQLLQNNKAKTGEKTNAAPIWSKNMSRSIHVHTWRDTKTASQYLTKEGSEQLNSWIIVFSLALYIYIPSFMYFELMLQLKRIQLRVKRDETFDHKVNLQMGE